MKDDDLRQQCSTASMPAKTKSMSSDYGTGDFFKHVGMGFALELIFCFVLVGIFDMNAHIVLGFAFGFFAIRQAAWLACRYLRKRIEEQALELKDDDDDEDNDDDDDPLDNVVMASLIITLSNVVPFLVYGLWLTEEYVQLDATAVSKTCAYNISKKAVTSLAAEATSIMGVPLGSLVHKSAEANVTYWVPKVECKAEHSWAEFAAPYVGMIVSNILAFAVPAVFAFIVLGAMKSISMKSNSHQLKLTGSFLAIEMAVLDFFDACMFLSVTFEPSGVNFVYLSANPAMWIGLRAGFVLTFAIALFETLLPFKPFGQSFQTEIKTALISALVDIPLGLLRLGMLGKGLKCDTIMLAKNLILIVTEVAVLVAGLSRKLLGKSLTAPPLLANNPISMKIGPILGFLPGFKKLADQATAEKEEDDDQDRADAHEGKKMKHWIGNEDSVIGTEMTEDDMAIQRDRMIRNLKKKDSAIAAIRVCTAVAMQTQPPSDYLKAAFKHYSDGGSHMGKDGIKKFEDEIWQNAKDIFIGDQNDPGAGHQEYQRYMDKVKLKIKECIQESAGEHAVGSYKGWQTLLEHLVSWMGIDECKLGRQGWQVPSYYGYIAIKDEDDVEDEDEDDDDDYVGYIVSGFRRLQT